MSLARLALPLLLATAGPAAAEMLQLPAAALDRTGPVVAIWRPASPRPGTLRLDWTDAAGRLVERHRAVLDEAAPEIAVPLDLRRARVPGNHVEARFQPRDGGPATLAEADFVARPAPGWRDYQVLMWQDIAPADPAVVGALGITGTKLLHPLSPEGEALRTRLVAAGLRWYDENLATDFYAAYHRWRPGLSVTWLFDRARARHRQAPGDISVFERQPSLSDPAWLGTIRARLGEVARRQAPYRPLFLDLGDETGIADLAAAWDFDLSAPSLSAMRDWLRARYGTLAALDRAWGADFATWDAVRPALTDATLRGDAAVPSWMDFKAWMDVAFARAVRAGTDAVHHGDPQALAGLEGGQVPGWGGYDYGLLAPSVDLMEIYDLGNSIEIARSMNPGLRVLTTSFASGPAELRRLWHALLLGAAGTIVWDDTGDVIRADGRPGPRGETLAPLFRRLTGPLGAQMLDAEPAQGQVAILYSQASFRLTWLLARRGDSAPWERRDAEAENADNPWRAAGRRAARLLAGLGAQPRWITPETLASGTLSRDGTRLLVLPHSIALSDAELAAIRRFAQGGGLVLADGPPGERDALGRVRAAPPLADLAASGRLRFPASLRQPGAAPDEMDVLLEAAGVRRPLTLLEADGRPASGVDVRLFRSGGALVAGIQRTDAAAGERSLTLRLPAPLWVRRIGGAAPTGPVAQMPLTLGQVEPALLVLAAAPPPGPSLSAPAEAAAGALLPIRLGLRGPTPMAAQMVRVEVLDPGGRVVPVLSQTVRVPPQGCVWQWPLAVNDTPGAWRVRATDAVTGEVAAVGVRVGPAPAP